MNRIPREESYLSTPTKSPGEAMPEENYRSPVAKEMKTTMTPKKKVKWRPAKLLDTIGGLDTNKWTYRWVNTDPANVARKMAEGWARVNRLEGDKATQERGGVGYEGESMSSSLTEYRELTLMKLPVELAAARKEYYEGMTADKTSSLKNDVSSRARALGGNITGSIKILDEIIE